MAEPLSEGVRRELSRLVPDLRGGTPTAEDLLERLAAEGALPLRLEASEGAEGTVWTAEGATGGGGAEGAGGPPSRRWQPSSSPARETGLSRRGT